MSNEEQFNQGLEDMKKKDIIDVLPKANPFNDLNNINVNKHTEKKNGLTYLSWAWAWTELCTKYDDVSYIVREWNDLPYLFDNNLGYLVETSVSINGITHSMRLPVMNGANKSMKSEPYTYQTKFGEKSVEAATMFDINTAIMRCLVKNLAMFGLGLYIYAGEDLPESEKKKPTLSDERFKKSLEAVKAGNYKAESLKSNFDLTPEQLNQLS